MTKTIETISARPRDTYFQIWRGICIVAVVLKHCYGASADFSTLNGIYSFLSKNLLAFPVALFFVLSGYFTKTVNFQNGNYRNTMKDRAIKLLVPYFMYTAFYTALRVIAFEMKINFTQLLKLVFLGQAATPLYYVLTLFLFVLITPILVKCINNKSLSIVVFVFSFAVLGVFYCLELTGHDVWFYARYTIVWLPFYYFGMLVRYYSINFNKLKKISFVFVILAFAIELCGSAFLLNSQNGQTIAFSQISISAFIYAFSLVILMFSNHKPANEQTDNFIKKVLPYLGDNSYGIYFIHYFFIMVFDVFFDKIPFELPLPIHRGAECAIVIALSLVSIKIIKFVFGKNSTLFGV